MARSACLSHLVTLALLLMVTWFALGVTTSLQWPRSETIPDNVTVPACDGINVTLPWNHSGIPEEQIMLVEWMYRADGASEEKTIAIELNDRFVIQGSTRQSLEYIPGAGIRVLNVTAADSGTYSEHVTINVNGSTVSHVQSVNVVVTAAAITADGSLHAQFGGARFLNSTQEHHLILICGTFNPLWMPLVDVVWTTPMNETVASTFQENGRFFLAVPNPFIGGNYTCNIDSSSTATLCIPSNSPLKRGATVLADSVEGRISLVGSEMQTTKNKETQMERQIQMLQASNSALAGHVKTLQSQQTATTQMARQIQMLQASNSALAEHVKTLQSQQNATTQMARQIQMLQASNSALAEHVKTLQSQHTTITQMQTAIWKLKKQFGQMFEIRLVGGSNSHEGRVDIRVGTTWGTVCDDLWDIDDTYVACRQLGYNSSRAQFWCGGHFRSGSDETPILLDDVQCAGTEDSLLECQYRTMGVHNCRHTEDVGIRCA